MLQRLVHGKGVHLASHAFAGFERSLQEMSGNLDGQRVDNCRLSAERCTMRLFSGEDQIQASRPGFLWRQPGHISTVLLPSSRTDPESDFLRAALRFPRPRWA